MREAPRQPKHLDREDESTLAAIGERLERWQVFKDDPRPLEEKLSDLISGLTLQFHAHRDAQRSLDHPEVEMQNQDVLTISKLHGKEIDAEQASEERIQYYRELREKFIQQL